MKEQTDLQPAGPKVVEDLRFRGLMQLECRLDLNNELSVHDHVDTLLT
jgi:hypothetical protein